jgi:glycosyltransferase involved in cell wall biosynthesis
MLHPGPEPAPIEEPEGVTTHPLRSKTSRLSCLATQQLGHPVVHRRQIRQLLETHDFDVIHFHSVSLVGGPGILAYGDAIKLYTAHEHWLVCPTHVLWRHGRELCDERQCFSCVLRHRRPPQLWRRAGLLERKSRHVDAFLSPSRFSADKHAAFGFERELQVLPLFLPDEPAAPEPDGPGDDASRPFFLFVGRLEKIKGLQEVIPLFGKDAPADLWIAGRGEYEPELRRLAQGHSVRFLGMRSPGQLRSLYTRTLALLAPSLCYEVFPMVVLEAFRDGAPVVARRRGPYPEMIEHSGGGLLFETPAELEQALARLASDPSLRESLGRAGRKAFQEQWSEPPVLARYFELIRRLAHERGMQQILDRVENEAQPASLSE